MLDQRPQNKFQVKQTSQTGPVRELSEQGGGRCPHCNMATLLGADVCAHCGTWQLAGKCCFCNGPVREGQKFCGSCGNEPEGRVCSNCGTHSLFDFCPKCDHPVSKGAPAYLDEIKALPQVKDIIQQINSLDLQSIGPDWLTDLNNYAKRSAIGVSTDLPHQEIEAGFVFGTSNKDISEQLNQAAQDQKEVGHEADTRAKHEELRKKIAALQERAFSSNQEARKFYTGIAIALPQLRTTFIEGTSGVWLCNYANVTHNRPADCACPEMGGQWIGGDPAKTVVDIVYQNI